MNDNQQPQHAPIPLHFDPRILDYIVNVVAQRPYAEAAPIIDNIRQQVADYNQTQQNAPQGVSGGVCGAGLTDPE